MTPRTSMYGRIRTTLKLISSKVGWNWLGVVLSLTIITAAAVVLYRMLQNLNFSEVVTALKAYGARDILIAAGFVAAGYVTLTFYDLFALRTIGKNHVPY